MSVADLCKDLVSLANFLELAPQRLFFLSTHNDSLYIPIKIKKRNSTASRDIYIPTTELKGVQRIILQKILHCFPVHNAAYAYVQKKGVVKAANQLKGPNHILRFDITDFFPSISAKRIYGLFQSFGFNRQVSYLLTKLTTYEDSLCQGAPTSPYLSNLVCTSLDKSVNSMCESWDLKYLRYSDDLIIWGSQDFNFGTFSNIIQSIVSQNGFEMNKNKTRFLRKDSHRHVLGLLITDEAVKIPRKKLRQYRSAFYKASQIPKWGRENLDRLSGIASYYKTVYGIDDRYIEFSKVLKNIKSFKVHEAYAV